MRIRKTVVAWAAAFLILGGAASAQSVRRLVLPTNDLVFNPVDGRIYASIPSRAGALGNRIAAIDPESGAIVRSIPVGSEPRKLALSDDGRFLYAGLDGAGAVRRVDLVKQTVDAAFSLGRQGFFEFKPGPNFAEDLKVLPGHPESVVVSRSAYTTGPRHTGVVVYDNGVPRPQILAYFTGDNVLAFGDPPSRLYGYDQEDDSFEFRRMTVDASGVLPGGSIAGLISGVVDIEYDSGRIYTSSGLIIDPEAATVEGQFPGIPPNPFGAVPSVLVHPEAAAERVYFVVQTDGVYRLLVFDSQSRALLGSVDAPYSGGLISSLVRWGSDGLAFRTSKDELFLIRSALVPADDLALRLPPAGTVGGGAVEGRLTLRAPAPAAGSVVALHSDDAALAAVPAQVTVPAGAVTVAFPIVTAAVTQSTPVGLTAAAGTSSAGAALQLLPAATPVVSPRPASLVGGALASGTVALPAPAPPGGLVLRLSSDHPAVAAVPAEISLPAGATRASFSVLTSPVLETTPVTIAAVYGESEQSVAFTVLAPGPSLLDATITRIQLPTRDLIYDPFRGKIYASVPSSGGRLGNSLAAIDPVSGAIEGTVIAGSEPGKLALSDDGSSLYVGLDGAGAVRRFDLVTGMADRPFPLETGSFGPYAAADMQVAPGNPHVIAVARIDTNPHSLAPGGVAIYEDGIARPTMTARETGPTVLAFSASASRLYGYDNRDSGFGFYQMSVDPSGVFIQENAPDLIYNFEVGIQYAAGLIYASSGRVIDPEALALRGIYDGVPFESLMTADAPTGRVFFLTRDGTRWWLRAYEQQTFLPLGAVEIPGVSGVPASLIRCGAGGLAFRVGADQVFLIHTPLAPSDALAIRFDPDAVAGGLSAAGTITLGSPAPPGGAAVDLTSDRSDLVLVPPRVTVPEGATTVTFPVSTTPVTQAAAVAVAAAYGGVSRSAILSVRPEALLSVTLRPEDVVGGRPATGMVEVGFPAPAGGLLVALASDDPAVTLPATVNVPAGATTATFPVCTEPVPVDRTAVVSATLQGATRIARLQIEAPVLVAVTATPSVITAGDQATGSVVISSPAPKDGLPIELYSGSENVMVPDSVTVPAGATVALFPITSRPVDQGGSIRIAAEYGVNKQITYLKVEPRPVLTLTVSPTRVLGGQPAVGKVTLTDPAPAGGAVIRLTSDRPDLVLVPPQVTVPGGATMASFPVTTQPPAEDDDTGVGLRASWSGHTAVAGLYVTGPIPVSLTVKPAAVEGGRPAEATVTLDAPARAGGRLLKLSTDHPAAAEVPAQIVVPAGATTATFAVTTHAVTAPVGVTITASTYFFAAVATMTVDSSAAGN